MFQTATFVMHIYKLYYFREDILTNVFIWMFLTTTWSTITVYHQICLYADIQI